MPETMTPVQPPETDELSFAYEQIEPFFSCLSVVVFVQGNYCPHLSRATGLDITAIDQGGAILTIPPAAAIDEPLQVITLGDQTTWFQVVVGAGSSITIFRNSIGSGTSVCDAQVGKKAALHVESVRNKCCFPCCSSRCGESPCEVLRATVEEQGRCSSCMASFVSAHYDQSIKLKGADAEASVTGCTHVDGCSSVTHTIRIEHEAPRGVSRQLFKNLVDGCSRVTIDNTIHINDKAVGSDAHLLNKSLPLNEASSVQCCPNLEIAVDDVKAAHGSTTGTLDARQLLYLRSRGICERKARQLLIEGFLQDVDFTRRDDNDR